jgi:hypothetical protein
MTFICFTKALLLQASSNEASFSGPGGTVIEPVAVNRELSEKPVEGRFVLIPVKLQGFQMTVQTFWEVSLKS